MRILLISILILGLSSVAYAGEETVHADCVSPAKATSVNGKNKWHLHDHCYTDTDTDTWRDARKNPVGVGIDIPLYTSEKADVENQNKYDFRNSEYSNFTVVKVKLEEGLLNKLFKKFKKDD